MQTIMVTVSQLPRFYMLILITFLLHDLFIHCTIIMDFHDQSQHDTILFIFPPFSELKNVWPEPLQNFNPGNDLLISIACQSMSNLTTEKYSGDEHTLEIEGEERELSDGSNENNNLSIFSATFSSDSASSVKTVSIENGYPAGITVIFDM